LAAGDKRKNKDLDKKGREEKYSPFDFLTSLLPAALFCPFGEGIEERNSSEFITETSHKLSARKLCGDESRGQGA
jgi:hypothetical protein